jgi:hypothetical protein
MHTRGSDCMLFTRSLLVLMFMHATDPRSAASIMGVRLRSSGPHTAEKFAPLARSSCAAATFPPTVEGAESRE